MPTIEEMYQDAEALEGAYNEGVRSSSDSDFPPEDIGMWLRREEPIPDRQQGPSSGSDDYIELLMGIMYQFIPPGGATGRGQLRPLGRLPCLPFKI